MPTTETAVMPVTVYTEMTPNPETMKFVTDRMLLTDVSADFPEPASAVQSPFAIELFGFPFVRGVFIMNNFVTLTKTADTDWYDVIPAMRVFIKNYLEANKPVFSTTFKPTNPNTEIAHDESDIVKNIKEMLDNYVKPAVEMDGGAIQFKSYEDGKVTLLLQGSCSGCPSSMVTLKSGIEGLLKRMVPEVTEVVAEAM
jgi:NFU1 iron-sulfur cluster scaffold homolog, mitochondrial